MKTLFAATLLVACLALASAAQHGQSGTAPKHSHPQEPSGEVVKRGAAVGDSERVEFADVLKEPQKFTGRRVVIEGVVERVCKKEGCWMQIAPEAGSEESVRVTFDHKFSVPKNADAWKFRAEGEFSLKVLSKEEVEHLVKDDGAKIKRNDDGTANEISFVATGVELWK